MSRLIPFVAAAVIVLGSAPGAHAADVIVRAGQDTAVDATAPKRHAGAATRMRVSARPLRRAFVRFDLRSVVSTPTKARLDLYVSSRSGGRVDVRSVVKGQRWSERRTTFKTAPAVTSALSRSARLKRAGWTAIDVTKLISPGAIADLAVTGAPLAVIASRESSHPPRLVITQRVAPIASPFTPPSVPPPFAGIAPVVALTGVGQTDEGTVRSFAYAVTDPDSNPAITQSCGDHAEPVGKAGAGSFQCRFPDGPAKSTVSVAADDGTSIGRDQIAVTIANVAPTATLSNSGPIAEATAATIRFSDASDPSPADTAAGFRYAFHCDGSEFDPAPTYADASTSSSTSCAFAGRGRKTVRARIIDKNGGFRDYTTDVTVTNGAPTLTVALDQRAGEGSAKEFLLGSFADVGDAGPWTVDVDWGDGSPPTRFTTSAPGPLAAKSHVYADGPAGETVAVTVTDSAGGRDTATFRVSVDNVAPTLALDPANPTAVDEGQTRTYRYTVSDPGDDTIGPIVTSCGPGGEGAGASAGSFSCRFPDGPADTVVSATATDSDGANGSASQAVHVANVAPSVQLHGTQTADEGQSYTYTYTITDPGDDPDPTVTESCGAGGVRTDTPAAGSFDCFFPDGPAGSTVSVTADDGDSTGRTDTQAVVRNVAPTVTPAADQTAQTGTSASIDLGSFTDPNLSDHPWTVVVDWGDGSAKTTFEAAAPGPLGTRDHTYAGDGDQLIRVSVTDKDGGTGVGAPFGVHSTSPAATLTVLLDATPDSPQDFGFTLAGDPGEPTQDFALDDDADPQLASQRTFELSASGFGHTTLTGPQVAGWSTSAADLSCDGAVATVDAANRRLDFDVTPGAHIVCRFHYLRDATVTVVEDADPDSSQAFAFTATAGQPFTLRDDGTPARQHSFTVAAGAFGPTAVTQDPMSFWALGTVTCTGDPDWVPAIPDGRANLVVDPGEAIVCTFANRRVASTVGGVFPESSSVIGPVTDSNGNLYTVTELEALDPRPCLRKSTDGGRTWTEVDAANRPSYDDLESVSLVKDRSKPYLVHMLMQRSGTNRVSYNTFNMSDAPSAPDTWQTKNEVVAIPGANQNDPATDSTPKDEWVSLVQRSNGDLIAFYATSKTVPGPTGKEQIGYKIESGGVWGPEQLLPGASPTDSYTQGVAEMGDGDVTHVFYKNDATERILYRTLDANGTWGATKDLTLHGTNSADHIIATPVAHLHVVRPSDGKVVERFVVGWKNSSDRTLHGTVIDDGALVQTDTAISDVAVLSNPGSTQSVQTVAGFVADDDADKVYAVYSDDATHDLYYDVLPASGTWGKDIKALSGYEVMEIEPIVFPHDGAKVLGVLFDDNIGWETLRLDNVPRYTEIPIG
jgi:hypothetical protein